MLRYCCRQNKYGHDSLTSGGEVIFCPKERGGGQAEARDEDCSGRITGNSTVIVVPELPVSMRNLPLRTLARSRIDPRPTPLRSIPVGIPLPWSATRNRRRLPLQEICTL